MSLFDTRQVQRAFARSAATYDAAARLQHEIEARLLESLDYLDDPALQRAPPAVVLDLGCGPGRASIASSSRNCAAVRQPASTDVATPSWNHRGSGPLRARTLSAR